MGQLSGWLGVWHNALLRPSANWVNIAMYQSRKNTEQTFPYTTYASYLYFAATNILLQAGRGERQTNY